MDVLFFVCFFKQKMLLYFTQHPLHACHFFSNKPGVISPTHDELVLKHLVTYLQMHFKCVPLNDLCVNHKNDFNTFLFIPQNGIE